MDVPGSKVLTMFVLLVGTLVCGLTPIYLRRKLLSESPRSRAITSLLLCFGAGVLLATSFVHILPEAHELFFAVEATKDKPISGICLCAGFFLIYLIEELVHYLSNAKIHRKIKDMYHHSGGGLHRTFSGLQYELEDPWKHISHTHDETDRKPGSKKLLALEEEGGEDGAGGAKEAGEEKGKPMKSPSPATENVKRPLQLDRKDDEDGGGGAPKGAGKERSLAKRKKVGFKEDSATKLTETPPPADTGSKGVDVEDDGMSGTPLAAEDAPQPERRSSSATPKGATTANETTVLLDKGTRLDSVSKRDGGEDKGQKKKSKPRQPKKLKARPARSPERSDRSKVEPDMVRFVSRKNALPEMPETRCSTSGHSKLVATAIGSGTRTSEKAGGTTNKPRTTTSTLDTVFSSPSFIKDFITVLALSFHAIFEGLAVGLSDEVSEVWQLFGAVAAHKFVIAFSFGMELMEASSSIKLHVVYVSSFALMSVLGIAIGTGVTEASTESDAYFITLGVLQAFAAGTLVYVAISEVLERERLKKVSGLLQLLASIVGFSTMTLIDMLTHTHGHGHGHGHGGEHGHKDHEEHDHEHEHEIARLFSSDGLI